MTRLNEPLINVILLGRHTGESHGPTSRNLKLLISMDPGLRRDDKIRIDQSLLRGMSGLLLVLSLLLAPLVAEALQDPTRPLRATEGSPRSRAGDLRLESVLISQQRRLAVINGQTLRENDAIGTGKVLRILPGVVEIRQEDRILRLEMHSNIRMPKDSR